MWLVYAIVTTDSNDIIMSKQWGGGGLLLSSSHVEGLVTFTPSRMQGLCIHNNKDHAL